MATRSGRGLILYKYYPPRRVDILSSRLVYFSHPNRFNDPFELEPHLEGVVASPEQMATVVETFRKQGHQVDDAAIQALNSDDRKREQIDELKKNLLILSLSEEPHNLLMWAHYGAAHTGFVIGFNMSKDSFALRADGKPRNLSKVRYSTHRPSASSVHDLRDDEVRLTKSVDWMHEKEWRMFESPFNADGEAIDAERMCWPFRFEADAVDRVVLGARMSKATEEALFTILRAPEYKDVKIIRSSIDPQQFRLGLRLEIIHDAEMRSG